MKKPLIEIILPATYLAAIDNSAGSRFFQNLFARVDGKKADILRGGELSCAFFVSSLLLLFGLISRKHANVDSTLRSMRRSGWYDIARPKRGAVIVWGIKDFGKGDSHKHIGFCLDGRTALSHSFYKKTPVRHDIDSAKLGPIERILWHPRLDLPLSKKINN